MTTEHVALFQERMARLRLLRERTGAPLSLCDRALKASNGDVEAAAKDPGLLTAHGIDTGDPRHRCRDDCPPWPFARGHTDVRGHRCDTHCAQHPDPRSHSLALVRELFDLGDDMIEGALRICGWDAGWAAQFLREAGARSV